MPAIRSAVIEPPAGAAWCGGGARAQARGKDAVDFFVTPCHPHEIVGDDDDAGRKRKGIGAECPGRTEFKSVRIRHARVLGQVPEILA